MTRHSNNDPPICISVREAADRIKVTKKFLLKLINQGMGPPVRRFGTGKRRVFRLPYDGFLKWAAEEPAIEQHRRRIELKRDI